MGISSVDGEFVDHISVDDRGLAYGDGIFETVRLIRGSSPLWNYHMQRLGQGAQRLFLHFDEAQLESYVTCLLDRYKSETSSISAVLKIILTRGSGLRGYGIDPSSEARIILQVHDLDTSLQLPKVAKVCDLRLGINPALAGLKHLNRIESVLAVEECRQGGFEEGILLDTEGYVVEACSSNLFVEKGGLLLTPPVDRAGVNGVMRRYILEVLASELRFKVREERFSPELFSVCDGAFCSNSVRGIMPLASIDNVQFSQTSTISDLNAAVETLFRNE